MAWSRAYLRQLAEVVCILEADAERHPSPTRQVTNVRTNPNRSHLPPLQEADIIKWASEDRDVILPRPAFGDTI